jgi:ABC-type Fe3+ transport system permease subunit
MFTASGVLAAVAIGVLVLAQTIALWWGVRWSYQACRKAGYEKDASILLASMAAQTAFQAILMTLFGGLVAGLIATVVVAIMSWAMIDIFCSVRVAVDEFEQRLEEEVVLCENV